MKLQALGQRFRLAILRQQYLLSTEAGGPENRCEEHGEGDKSGDVHRSRNEGLITVYQATTSQKTGFPDPQRAVEQRKQKPDAALPAPPNPAGTENLTFFNDSIRSLRELRYC